MNLIDLTPKPTHQKRLPKSRDYPTFALANCRSVLGKLDEIEARINVSSIDIFAATETWLTSAVLDSAVTCSGFSCIRKDRAARIGGGVMVLIRHGINYRIIDTPLDREIIAFHLPHYSTLVVVLYHPYWNDMQQHMD